MSCFGLKKHEEEAVEVERRSQWPLPRKTISRWMKKLKSVVEKKNKKVEREHVVVDMDRRAGATCDGRDSSSTIASGLDESEHVVVDLDHRTGATCESRDSSSTIASGLDESERDEVDLDRGTGATCGGRDSSSTIICVIVFVSLCLCHLLL